MCESRHTRNVSFILHTQRLNSASAAVQVHTAAFPDDPYLETAISAALMRQVARAEIPPAIRLNRMAPILAFGKLDRLRPGYRRAVTIAREAGYLPVERIAGGRAAVFHEGTISFSHAIRAGGGSYAGTHERFAAMAATIAAAGSALGADARVGEVPGEYCPGEFSVNSGGRIKLAGIGQRVIVGGAHVGAVVVVRGATRINEVLEPVYEALGLEFEPDATGSLAAALGESDEPHPLGETDRLIESAVAALRTELAKTYELREAPLAESTLQLAEQTRDEYRPRV